MTPRTPSSRRTLGRMLPLLFGIGLFVVILAVLAIRRPWEVLTRPASIPTEDRQIAFMSNRDGDWDIYLLTLATGEVINLSGAADDGDGFDDDGFAAWSADGGALTFLSNRTRAADGRLDAFLMDADGQNARPLENDLPTIMSIVGAGRFNWDLSFAVSGALAFVTLRDLNLETYLQPPAIDGTTAPDRNLTTHPGIDWFAAWSPDAGRLAFASNRDGGESGDQEIYVIDVQVEGAQPARLTVNPTEDIFPAWTSDGRILFYSERETTLRESPIPLYLVDPQQPGTAPVRVDGELLGAGGVPVQVDAQYAPAGDAQVYMIREDSGWDIVYADAAGQSILNLTAGAGTGDDIYPVWRTN